MPLMEHSHTLKLEELQKSNVKWTDKQTFNDERDYDDWLNDGIEIYEQFARLNRESTSSHIKLADLYLQAAKNERMRAINLNEANNVLRRAMRFSPESPEPYYHLSFLMSEFGRNEFQWEASLFYAHEALKYGLSKEKSIKLLCNMALAYKNLKLKDKSHAHLEEAAWRDIRNEFGWFITLYADKVINAAKGKILMKASGPERVAISRREYQKVKEAVSTGTSIILDLSQQEKRLLINDKVVRLEQREGELLGFLMDQSKQPCSISDIEKSIWIRGEVGEIAVKRYLSTIYLKLSKAMNHTDIEKSLLICDKDTFTWSLDLDSYVMR